MFKVENRIWWYLLGVIVMMVLLLVSARDFFIPLFFMQRTLVQPQEYVFDAAPIMQIEQERDYFATFYTNRGVIVVDLYEKAAPQNVNNFVYLAGIGYYTNTLFHRLIPDFLVQGGDRNTLNSDLADDGRGGPGYFVPDEINWDALNFSAEKRAELSSKGYKSTPSLESHHLERLSMAMASNGVDTNGSQFFFTISSERDPRLAQLDGYFTVVGQIVSGADVLKSIGQIPVDDPNANAPRPTKVISIERIEISAK